MRSHSVTIVLALASTLALAGCQQSDGPIPVKNEEVTNRIEDVAHDISNVARGNPQAPGELTEDLVGFLEGGAGQDTAKELGQRLATAVTAKRVTDEAARQLADRLWTGMAARELSERQQEELLNDVRDLLMSMNVERAEVEAVTTKAAEMQKAISTRPRRWYERF